MISIGAKVQTNKFQKGATGVDVDIMILIKFNDTK
jgi:hypothetical protein